MNKPISKPYPLNSAKKNATSSIVKSSITIFLAFMAVFFSLQVYADDPGITKVRLIQETDSSYILEIDIPQSILGEIKSPLLPPGFVITPPERKFKSGWVTLKAKISGSPGIFKENDVIILPWNRNAVDITAQWLNGDTYKGFFTRSLNGIHIPLRQLMSVEKSPRQLFLSHFKTGLKHFGFRLIHIILIFILVLLTRSRRVFSWLLIWSIGQMSAMCLAELHMLAFDLLYADILIIGLIFLSSYWLIRPTELKHFALILFLGGIIHGLSYGNELLDTDLKLNQRVQAMFAFNLALDFGHFALALVLLPLLKKYSKRARAVRLLSWITGILSVFLVFMIADQHTMSGNNKILDFQKTKKTVMYKDAGNSAPVAPKQISRSKGMMTTPIMIFLSIEPYETRKEILIRADVAKEILGTDEGKSNKIPVSQQNDMTKALEKMLLDLDNTVIDNKISPPDHIQANFVTLSRGGVVIKESPVEEDLNESILGVTLRFTTNHLPDSISTYWRIFPSSLSDIEATVVDPHGTFTGLLSKGNERLQWESRIKGFRLPAIEPIEAKHDPLPLVSVLLWLILAVIIAYARFKRDTPLKQFIQKKWVAVSLVVGFLMFPHVRPPVNIPVVNRAKPSVEKGGMILGNLLGNIYRAFDRRSESVVYDYLDMSVTAEQLTEIYLQNRQSMALENRGGARATVDEVKLENLYSLKRQESNTYKADVKWTVRGSVNHFGHTHYRQNQYRAEITFSAVDQYWKISSIEILDARRLY